MIEKERLAGAFRVHGQGASLKGNGSVPIAKIADQEFPLRVIQVVRRRYARIGGIHPPAEGIESVVDGVRAAVELNHASLGVPLVGMHAIRHHISRRVVHEPGGGVIWLLFGVL